MTYASLVRPDLVHVCAGVGAALLLACGGAGGGTASQGMSDSVASESDSETGPNQPTGTTVSGTESESDGQTGTDTVSPTSADTDGDSMSDPGSSGTTSAGVTEGTGECGNAVLEPGEQCDDGNQADGDGCESNCLLPHTCGDGKHEVGEACDDGNTMNGDTCSADCQVVTPLQDCGNGSVEMPELCDDGNQAGGDGCEADCTFTPPECGNGKIEAGEACDDGNDVDGGDFDFCNNDCTKSQPAFCGAPENYVVCDDAIDLGDKSDPRDALRAIGVCDLQADDSIVVTAFEFDPAAQPDTWQVARGFGSYVADLDGDPNTPPQRLYAPREGEAFLMLSTGRIAAPDAEGVVLEDTNSQVGHTGNGNSGDDALPPPFKAEDGSNGGMGGTPFTGCDNGEPGGDRDCSDTLQAQWQKTNGKVNDRIYFTFDTVVPAATHGFTFDFVFCSSEWPGSVGTVFNDMFFVYQVDPTPDDPNANPPVDAYSGNVAFIPDPDDPTKGLPVTITALDSYFDGPGYTKAEPQLWGTGFETHACSDWFTARGGVQPGAEITVGFFLADMSDANFATVALIDAFRWDCEGCVPSEADDCGIKPQ
ncbi:choice-of-anchor L domain-containing protein [Nannocystis radixulma]|uniref:Choice-of-anchor L domain-containing protein n=1 Tax=Nannocystis radixulma TaxID=2995305 RepID=A0ABT5AZ51_9BACT|nr:choice-of-anchor L domain-containing protein [Nannocystis radixulma]MDC0667108.1 choice-of-anchor L domain-containing protein [Nannocystis radixulma]